MAIIAAVLAIAGWLVYRHWFHLFPPYKSRGLNSHGGDITVINARIWTGDVADPWKTSLTVKDGKIVSLDTPRREGRVIDAGGRLVVPGLWDGHAHPQAPYVLTSPEAPTLFGAKTLPEVLERLKKYVEEHPEDKFPRLFGWMSSIFTEGQEPTRQMIDAVVSDRPVYLVHHTGHFHWANTKALELAGALEKDPAGMSGDGHIKRDPETGLATGYLEETEYAATHGVLLNAVRKAKPYSLLEQAIIQRFILDEYSRVGVTSIWAKDGDTEITRVYEKLLRDDALPVRATLDSIFTPYSKLNDLAAFKKRADEIAASDLPKHFLRTDVVKLFIDLPRKGWIWMFEPYTDGSGSSGKPAFPLSEFREQMLASDRMGLQINISVYGDKALHECLNYLEEIGKAIPPRPRRHMIEHAEFIQDADLPRFRSLGVIASMNPNGGYPEESFQKRIESYMGRERLDTLFQRYRDLLSAGALVVNGSDFPLFPMDPLIGIHILVSGTDIDGNPPGGIYPKQRLTVEEALRTYTVNPAYANFAEDRLGMLKEGYEGDFVILSENILDPEFVKEKIGKVKAVLTVLNGHVTHEDWSTAEKVIDFAH